MTGEWIWIKDGQETENERVCFLTEFTPGSNDESIMLSITAVSKYQVWLNGEYLGAGPVRGSVEIGFFDQYEITEKVRSDRNVLAIEVWSYGVSTYQSLAERGGLLFWIRQGSDCLCRSDERVLCCQDTGHLSFAPKRNVNLGYTDYFDARKFEADGWKTGKGFFLQAVLANRDKEILPRPIRLFHEESRYPQRILRVEDVVAAGTVVSLNLRDTLFPGRRDADETIMTGFLGCELEAETEVYGTISFPNRAWNGILGDFRIGETVYKVTDADRSIPVKIPAGRSLFLLRFHDIILTRFLRKIKLLSAKCPELVLS